MSVSKEEFFDILREYASKEFEHIPKSDNEIDYEFSEEFEKKMEKLIDSIGNNKKPRKLNHRKTIAILIAAIIIAFAGAMSVGAIREPIVEFIYKIYDGFTDLFFEGDTTDKLSYIYSLSEIPEGFVETERLSNDSINLIVFESQQNGNKIELCQQPTEDISISYDNENGHIENFTVNGIEISVYISDRNDCHIAFWSMNSNYIELTYHGATTIDEMLKLISSIQ